MEERGSAVQSSENSSKVRQIVCPGCFEEMAKEELNGNKCPLCGYRLAPKDMDKEITKTDDEELTWMLTQNLQRTLLTWLMTWVQPLLQHTGLPPESAIRKTSPQKAAGQQHSPLPHG